MTTLNCLHFGTATGGDMLAASSKSDELVELYLYVQTLYIVSWLGFWYFKLLPSAQ